MNKELESPLTAREASRIVGCCYEQLLKEAKAGRIPHFKIGNRYFFRASTLEKWFLEKEREVTLKDAR